MRSALPHRYCLWFAITMLFCVQANAQERAHLFSIGQATQLDTYLSPETYKGIEVRWIEESTRHHRDSRFSHTWHASGYLSNTETLSGNNSNLSGMFFLRYGLHRDITMPEHLRLSIGASAEGLLGGIYNTRNGNNPAQLRAGINLAPSLRASYDFCLLKRNFRLNYNAHLPLAGLHFSPAFGQSYYEIFSRGNYDHNLCFASPINAPSLAHTLTLDLRTKGHAFTIGYLGDYRQTKFNDIKTKHITHALVIGWK